MTRSDKPVSPAAAAAEVPSVPPVPGRWRPWRPVGFFILSLGLTVLGVWIVWDFLPALVWAVVLAIATWPLFERLAAPRTPRGMAAAGFTLLIALVFIVPLIAVAVDVGREAVAAVQSARAMQQQAMPQPAWLTRLPWIGGMASSWWASHLGDPSYATDLLGRVDRSVALEWTRSLGSEVLHRLTLFAVTLLTLFFLFRDGPLLVRQTEIVTDRLFGSAGTRLARQMVTAVRATVNGLVLVGLGEGVLLGIAYAAAGLFHPVLLGALTALLAMIPFGAPIVLGFAGLILFGDGQATAAISVLVFGAVVIFVADHFVRPYFIGGATRLPFLWVLLGIFGGLEAFGLLGLFLGPAVMAALIELWRDWAGPEAAHSVPAHRRP